LIPSFREVCPLKKPIPKPLQFIFKTARRITTSPFLYLGLVSLGLALVFALFLCPKQGEAVLSQNALNQGNFLFSKKAENSILSNNNIVSSVFLEPIAPAFLVESKTVASVVDFSPKQEPQQYIVVAGDTLAGLAEKFSISLETLLWANNLTLSAKLKVGQELLILPVSGVLHIVQKGDTLSQIAKLYQVKTTEIIEFNGLGESGAIFSGDFLIVPNGKKPKATATYTTVPVPQSYFIVPMPSPVVISQGLHWFNAVDFNNNRCGDPVFASAGGTVQRTGYTDLGGNYVRLLHQNGVVTYYGHLSKIAVSVGQAVSQGQIIGYVGYTGVTIPAGPEGCHLHFDVRFATNPFAQYKVGTTF